MRPRNAGHNFRNDNTPGTERVAWPETIGEVQGSLIRAEYTRVTQRNECLAQRASWVYASNNSAQRVSWVYASNNPAQRVSWVARTTRRVGADEGE